MNRPVAMGYVFLVVAILLWSGNSVVGRWAMTVDVPPVALNFWRWVLALAILLPFTARRVWEARAEIVRHWRFLVPFGIVSVGCFNTFFYLGLTDTTAVQGALIQSVLPVLVLLLGVVVMREPISGRQALGVMLSIAGAATIVLHGDVAMLARFTLNVGDLWCLAAVSVWAIQTFILRWKPKELPIMTFMTAVIAIGIAVTAPFYVWETASGRPMPINRTSIAFVLYLGVFASAIASTMFNEGTYRVGGATAGYFGNLFPVFGAILAILILGEQFAFYHLIGGGLVLAGIYLATMARRARAPAAAGGA